jgi:hypothetical protein
MSEETRPGPLGTSSATSDAAGAARRAGAQGPGNAPSPGPLRGDVGHETRPAALLSQRSALELRGGAFELSSLRRVFGPVLNKSGKFSYVHFGKYGWEYRTDEYLRDREAFFGSTLRYWEYRDLAQAELDADGAKLRKRVEPPLARRSLRGWEFAQVVFYTWVRRAYENSVGANVNIPALISAGMSEALQAALKQVKLDYGHQFQYGGFNPRPMKAPGGYRLGTLSDHALGSAVDIEASNNAQIEGSKWNNILAFTGTSLDHATRVSKWRTAPEELHTAIVQLSAAFVTKLEQAVAAQVAAGIDVAHALDAAIAADAQLKQLGKPFVSKWRRGFFKLPWSLVKELHEEKFLWGATFSTPDLHHFQL